MSESSTRLMQATSKPSVQEWLAETADSLKSVGIDSCTLDAEIMLSHAIGADRTYLHAHPEQIINQDHLKKANLFADKRLKRIPVAYILGYKEFYGRVFKVTTDTLIPRPESEDIIDILKNSVADIGKVGSLNLIDVGTGSGCLGITAKLEIPQLDVCLLDISDQALKIAKENARMLNASIQIYTSNLLADYSGEPNIILANLPYVDTSWERSPETEHEPNGALFARDNGLALIKELIIQSAPIQKRKDFIILEADPRQHQQIINFSQQYGYFKKTVQGFALKIAKS